MSEHGPDALVQRARTDPIFLHELIFSPRTVIQRFDLTADERKILSARTPEDLFALAVSGGDQLECNSTCRITCIYTQPSGGAGGQQSITEVVNRAREDPSFFKRLHENPIAAISGIPLTPEERAAIDANTPEKLLGLLVGLTRAGCGDSGTCDETCSSTCSHTCSGGYTMSCGGTCDFTCDYTAGRVIELRNRSG